MADELQGLPDVDLSAVEADLLKNQDKGQQQDVSPQQTAQAPSHEDKVSEYDDQMLEKFKNPKEVLKQWKEIQAFTTKTAQEKKEADLKIQQLEQKIAEMEMMPPPQYGGGYHQPQQQDEYEDPDIARMVERKAMQIYSTMSIREVLDQEYSSNPTDFAERYQYVQMLGSQPQYAHLANSGQGVKKLFEKADEKRTEHIKKTAEKAVKLYLGDDIDVERLKQLLKKDKEPGLPDGSDTGFMPDTTTSTTRTATAQKQAKGYDQLIEEKVKAGDADAVTALLFKKQLEESV